MDSVNVLFTSGITYTSMPPPPTGLVFLFTTKYTGKKRIPMCQACMCAWHTLYIIMKSFIVVLCAAQDPSAVLLSWTILIEKYPKMMLLSVMYGFMVYKTICKTMLGAKQ